MIDINFPKLLKERKLIVGFAGFSEFQSDFHLENFYKYLFNTSEKNINEDSKINFYYDVINDDFATQKEALEKNMYQTALKRNIDLGFKNSNNTIFYNNILEYCKENNFKKDDVFLVLKKFVDFIIETLNFKPLFSCYHFNQEFTHLHLVLKKEEEKSTKRKIIIQEDEDF